MGDLLDSEDLAFLRETQADARPTAASLRYATPGGSDGMGGHTDATLGDPEPIDVRISRNMNLQANTVPQVLADQYGSALVMITADLVPISRGSTIAADGVTYTVVSQPNVQDWTTAQTLWAVAS